MPCLLPDQNFVNNFYKGHPRNISMKLFRNQTLNDPPPPLYFSNDQNFANNFILEKGLPMKLFQNLTSGFREKNFKEFL